MIRNTKYNGFAPVRPLSIFSQIVVTACGGCAAEVLFTNLNAMASWATTAVIVVAVHIDVLVIGMGQGPPFG